MGKYAERFQKVTAMVEKPSPAYVACLAIYGADGRNIGIIAPDVETLKVAWGHLSGFGGLPLDVKRIQQVAVFDEGHTRSAPPQTGEQK